jgi:hypothetical protein
MLLSQSISDSRMKLPPLLLIPILLISCSNGEKHASDNQSSAIRVDTVIKHDTVYLTSNNDRDWQEGFGLTHDPEKDSIWGKPVSYYLNDPECAGTAYDFYYGYFRPTDNGPTDDLLDRVTTDNDKLRPLYRWCLVKTMEVADGALGEHIGRPARRYAEKFPIEFFEYMDADPSGSRYLKWTSAIEYSGIYDGEDYNNPKQLQANLIRNMKANCKGCGSKMMKEMRQFAEDCFADRGKQK